ncbi:metallophosphoesterase [Geomonas agri]|uniref:metallophosphoesterase n=1 Tax=Geomonas agri TaxID=2873702 RepID=UPI001CD7A66B|nr:metallophosphoesterase [Geomonas agri]
MIYVTGDLHGGETSWHVSSANFKPAKKGDIVLCCGDLGGVWYHDYHLNQDHRRQEDYFLESRLRQRVTWLAVDGNHENFARLFGGEFPLVDLYGGHAYQVRKNVFYLKRGEVFTIEGETFLAFGGATSNDRFGAKIPSLGWEGGYDYLPPRKEGINWWPEELPTQEDYDNACRNLDRVGWVVDHVVTHTCPASLRPQFKSGHGSDPTEDILQKLYERLTFGSWHFGHLHIDKQVGKLTCHYNTVKRLAKNTAPEIQSSS